MALTAATPIVTHPAPLNTVAPNNCHGVAAIAHPKTPTASDSAPAFVTARNAEAPIERRQIGRHDRSRQEVHGDGRRDQGQRPSVGFANGTQEDRRPIEAEPQAENGETERRGDNAPSIERSASHRRQPPELCDEILHRPGGAQFASGRSVRSEGSRRNRLT
ncbi:hypothetical protein ACVWWO_005526 [Bradyrhizobium sp. F1.13.1]